MHRKIIENCVSIAKKEGIRLRQNFSKTLKKLCYQQRPPRSKVQKQQVKKANRRVKTIAGYLVRELLRKLPAAVFDKYLPKFGFFLQVLEQKRTDKDKIYRLHCLSRFIGKPQVKCIAKGKAHPKYEFGSKVSLAHGKMNDIVVGALNFEQNIYDGHTLPEVLQQVEKFSQIEVKKAIVDLGYKGRKFVGQTQIVLPRQHCQTPKSVPS